MMTTSFQSPRSWWWESGIILCAFAWIGAIAPAGAQEPTLNIGLSTAKPGDPVDIPLTISGNEQPQMGAIQLELTFPKDTLHYVRASAGLSGEMAGASVEGSVRDAPDVSGLSFLTISVEADQPIKPGILAYMHFRVSTEAEKGMVSLQARSVEAATLDGQPQPLVQGRDGEIEIFGLDETIPLIGCFFFTH